MMREAATTSRGDVVGYVHFDQAIRDNLKCQLLVRRDRVGLLLRNRYVRIEDPAGTEPKTYLGRIVEGPFFRPEEVSADSAIAEAPILQGEDFPALPNYYAVGGLEILGQLNGNVVLGTNSRPSPKAKVSLLTANELRELLGIGGDLFLGHLDGYPDLALHLDTGNKAVLPRNVGIFGTVGSGKTNTSQVLIEGIAGASWAVVVVDVEGEYVSMDKPTSILTSRLAEVGLKPEGLRDFHVYKPAAGESVRRDAKPFTLRTADLDPLVLTELLEPTEAQERRLLEVIEWLVHEDQKRPKAVTAKRAKPTTISEALTAKAPGAADAPYTLASIIATIDDWAFAGKPLKEGRAKPSAGADLHSYLALKGKLGSLKRTGAFDAPKVDPIRPRDLLVPGRVSVFDVSYSNDRLKNLVIAQLLRSIFDAKRDDEKLPRSMLVIEEAHTFISAERSGKMQETIELLREIARRGRKRWLGLTFISQQPSHLPNEIFELCNTRIVHSVKSEANQRALRATGGDVRNEMWDLLPGLGVGQCVLSTPQYRDPLVLNVRPSKARREFVG